MVATVGFQRVTGLPNVCVANTLYFVQPFAGANVQLYVTGNDAVPALVGNANIALPLAVTSGGTGGTSPLTARANLGLVIGSTIQAWNAGLDALAGATGTNTIYYRSGVNAWSPLVLGPNFSLAGGNLTIPGLPITLSGDVSGASSSASGAVNVTLATVPIVKGGTGATSVGAAQTALGVTATGADTTYAYRTNNLSDLASVSTARTNLGLGTLATQSGTFSGTSSGTNTGDQTSVSGNAGTATKLLNARNINGVPFDGSAAITINAADSTARLAVANNLSDVASPAAARGNISAAASGANSDITSLTGITGPIVITGNSQTLQAYNPSAPADSKYWRQYASGSGSNSYYTFDVANDAMNSFASWLAVTRSGTSVSSLYFTATATTFAGSLSSTGALAASNFSGTSSGTNTGDQTNITGNAGTATKLATGRTLATTGDLSWTSPAFDGSANVSAAATLANSGITAGTYGGVGGVPGIVFDAKGRATNAVNYVLGVAGGGTGDTGTAWTSYTPTASAASGTITSYTTSGRYKQIGKTTFVQVRINITTNGSASGGIILGLPFACVNTGNAADRWGLVGREVALNGKMLNGSITANSSTALVVFYDNTHPGADGAILTLSGTYESQ